MAALGSRVAIRPLAPADLEPLRWVIYRAYYEALLELYGAESASHYEVRSLDFMAMYLRRDPAGSFVAVTEDGTIAGGLFCFVWGEVGWFGSLAVAPELQGRGIAQRLTLEAIDYLRRRGCRRIGLETWTTAERTRHLYTKLGFERGRATIKLLRSLPDAPSDASANTSAAGAGPVAWTRPDDGDRAALDAALDAVDAIARAAYTGAGADEPRPNFRNEVRVPVISSFAELAIARSATGAPAAFALAYTRKPSGVPAGALDVRLLVAAPDTTEPALAGLLDALERRGRELGRGSITCDVNLRYARAAGLLRAYGFRPNYELIRMALPADGVAPAARSDVFECARWAG